MLRRALRCLAVVALMAAAAPGASGAQTADHLKCYQVKDTALARLRGIVDADPPQFPPEASCRIAKAKLFCVPATKAASVTNGADPIVELPYSAAPAPGDFICYKVSCTKPVPPNQVVTDQFGTRTFEFVTPRFLCTPAVKGSAYCGDGTLNGAEECDCGDPFGDCSLEELAGNTCASFGYAGGTLKCAAGCRFDKTSCTPPIGPTCGDGDRNGYELCEGSDLGGATCASLGFPGGELACTAGCVFDLSACTACPTPTPTPIPGNTASALLERANWHYLSAADSPALSIGGNLTIELWVRLSSTPTGKTFNLVSKTHDPGSANQYSYLFKLEDGKFVFAASSNGSTLVTKTEPNDPSLYAGAWVHLAAVKSGSLVMFYRNGAYFASVNDLPVQIFDSMAELEIGSYDGHLSGGAGGYLDALVDEVRVWSEARSASQIAADWQSCLSFSPSTLVAYYRLNGGGGGYDDASQYANGLTPHAKPGEPLPAFASAHPFECP